ncbi:melatonin receptor type 1B-B-like [Oculina patagonica]
MDSTEEQLAEMSKELKSRNTAKVVLETGFYAFILVLLFVGNFITLFVITFNRRMRTIPNMLVASLAITDFLLGAMFACPISLTILATSQWPFNETTCQYQGYVAITLALASTQTLALMAVNRYFRIVSPNKYRRYFTKKKTTIMILVLWFYCMWAPLPYILSGQKMVFHPSKFLCYFQIDSGPFTAVLVTVYIGLPDCVIFFCYLRIFQTVRSHNTNFQTNGVASNTVNVEEIKIARTLFVIVVFFNLCWTPVLLIDIVDTIRGTWMFPREAYMAWSFLATLNSALNPVIYGILNKNFQKEYLKVLRCGNCRSQTTVEPSKENGASLVVAPV